MLEVLEDLGMLYPTKKSKKKRRYYKCRCECGKIFNCIAASINANITTSCGCFKYKAKSHGLASNRNYNRWKHMVDRCSKPSNKDYINYGARGIEVCNEWENDPTDYIAYITSLPNANKKGYSLDRKDNNSNYKPGNMRWVTSSIQATNRRTRKTNTSGTTGVSWNTKNRKWVAQGSRNKKSVYLGSFTELSDAVNARKRFEYTEGV
jgi:hypothetical protein